MCGGERVCVCEYEVGGCVCVGACEVGGWDEVYGCGWVWG